MCWFPKTTLKFKSKSQTLVYQNADYHLFAIAEFGELANPRVMNDFEDLFVGLDQAMEELIH